MKKVFLISCLMGGVAIAVSCGNQNQENKQTAAVSQDSLVRLGEYLVNSMGCDDCHSPKVMGPQGPQVDVASRLSGHPATLPVAKVNAAELKDWVFFNHMNTAYVGPWGTSFSANLTSHETGIGNWSEQQFIKAMREGKAKGMDNGRMILPPMPWPNFKNLKDIDLKAIYAFLKTTKPVDNKVPAPIPPTQLTAL